MNSSSDLETPAPAFATAVVTDRSPTIFARSRFWWLALICLAIAIGLVFWSMPTGGTHITIHFPQGHGLQSEDSVRYRGIDVGMVETIELTKELDAVDVRVKLFPSAKRLAIQGTKFWIVRPQLSLMGVSGLETAVGHKYIKVQPGPAAMPPVRHFDGLADEPVDQGAGSGIEILLQADARHSVSVGSAIHFRGVDVGRILSVELSPDARLVEVRGKVEEAYRGLVTTEAKFWATGGVDFDFSLTQGLKLETESLDTLARGGVSMLVTGDGRSVAPGHAFPLAASVDENWIIQANLFRATSAKLRGAINLKATWTEPGLLGLGKRNRTETFTGVGVGTGSEATIVFPADVMKSMESAIDDSFKITVATSGKILETSASASVGGAVVTADLPADSTTGVVGDLIDPSEVCKKIEPSNWIAVRKSFDADVFHHLPIEVADIKLAQKERSPDVQGAQDHGQHWIISRFTGDRAVWHGTPVLQASTSDLVGILLIDDLGTTVVPVATALD